MASVAIKERPGRGANGAKHEVAIYVRFTSEQDALVREALSWTGGQLGQFIREAAVLRAREVLAAKRRAEADAAAPVAPPKAPRRK
jgi:uncharacterized protein (DUF1778 family)